MGILWWLFTDGIQWVIGGALALGGLFLWNGRKREGREEAMREQEIKGAQTRQQVEEDLARTPAAERRRRMLEWKR